MNKVNSFNLLFANRFSATKIDYKRANTINKQLHKITSIPPKALLQDYFT